MISRRIVDQVVAAKRDVWAVNYRVLRGVCRQYPTHTRIPEIVAKTCLIGRTYAAAVERGIRNDPGTSRDTSDFYRNRVAVPLLRSGIDGHIEAVRGFRRLTIDNAILPLRAHSRLVAVLKQSTGQEKRSFASKYLHFHAPHAFPIYDSYAERTLKQYVTGKVDVPVAWLDVGDPKYAAFVARCLRFRDMISAHHGVVLTPREIDRLLWKVPHATAATELKA